MASLRNKSGSEDHEQLTLHEMFRIVGDQMTLRDVRILKFLYTGILCEELRSQINDGFTFLLALEKMKRVDESNFKSILDLLRIITRHDLTQFVTLRKRRPVSFDPVDNYLEKQCKNHVIIPFSRKRSAHSVNSTESNAASVQKEGGRDVTLSQNSVSSKQNVSVKIDGEKHSSSDDYSFEDEFEGNSTSDLSSDVTLDDALGPVAKRRKLERTKTETVISGDKGEIKKKVTCDIRLRVRAEYCNHQSVLQGNVFSNKPTLVERQFEKFTQANTILRSRDLGSIHCDIKFSELTYLDAFWRDYVNGSLLEALKGVFITESLKQAVGHEAIKLLVNVDEDDYDQGRLKLLHNIRENL